MADELTPEEQERLDSYEEDDDMSGGGGGGEPDEPKWIAEAQADLEAKRTAGLATAAADPHAVGAAAVPLKPLVRSVTSQLAEAMTSTHVGAPAAAAALPSPAVRSSGADRTAAQDVAKSESDSDTDEDEVDTRTDEQKQQDEIANAISSEITRVESLGYKFKESTRWATVAAYLDAKELFDDEGLDLTSCDVGEKQKITLGNVTKKIAALRAAAAEKQQAVVPIERGESQISSTTTKRRRRWWRSRTRRTGTTCPRRSSTRRSPR